MVAAEHPQNGCTATASWSVHEAFVEPPWLRRLRGGFMKPSWSLRGCSWRHHGRFVEPSWSLRGALATPWCHRQFVKYDGPCYLVEQRWPNTIDSPVQGSVYTTAPIEVFLHLPSRPGDVPQRHARRSLLPLKFPSYQSPIIVFYVSTTMFSHAECGVTTGVLHSCSGILVVPLRVFH